MLIPTSASDALILSDSGPSDAPAIVYLPELLEPTGNWQGLPLTTRVPLRTLELELPGAGNSMPLNAGDNLGVAVQNIAIALRMRGIRDAMIVGTGVGGLLAQGMAAEYPDLVRTLVLINTGGKLGTPAQWEERALNAGLAGWLYREQIRLGVADPHSFSAVAYERLALTVAETDLRGSTARLHLPVLGLAGARDRVTPPDLLRELIESVPGGQFAILRGVGHLPLLQAPEILAAHLTNHLVATGHDLSME